MDSPCTSSDNNISTILSPSRDLNDDSSDLIAENLVLCEYGTNEVEDSLLNDEPIDLEPPKKKPRKKKGMKASDLFALENDIMKFCIEHHLLAASCTCFCNEKMHLRKRSGRGACFVWACCKRHRITKSLFAGTCFESSRMTIFESLWIIYMWVYSYPFTTMWHETNHSNQTLVKQCNFCREVCQTILERDSEQLGGLGKVVEIDEFKQHKPKYCSGKENEIKLYFGAVERNTSKCFLVAAPERGDEDMLLEIIRKYIHPGSIIFTNSWEPFGCIKKSTFEYLTNEYNLIFRDAASHINISSVKEMWDLSKRKVITTIRNKSSFITYFAEYIYKKKLSYKEDAFLSFLHDIATLYPPPTKLEKKDELSLHETERKTPILEDVDN